MSKIDSRQENASHTMPRPGLKGVENKKKAIEY